MAVLKNGLFGLFALTFCASCAKNSEDVRASYVSPLQYANYSCDQLSAEAQRISGRVSEVSGAQDDAATRDAVAVGVGAVLFWPALFFLAGGDNEAELSRLKGEFEAVEKQAIVKECGLAEDIKTAREQAAKKSD